RKPEGEGDKKPEGEGDRLLEGEGGTDSKRAGNGERREGRQKARVGRKGHKVKEELTVSHIGNDAHTEDTASLRLAARLQDNTSGREPTARLENGPTPLPKGGEGNLTAPHRPPARPDR